MSSDLMQRYPAVADLRSRARRRLPHFAWEFVDSGTGEDEAAARNVRDFSAVTLTPRFMRGAFEPKLATTLFGVDYAAPFGVAPVGMNGLIWPGTDRYLAAMAARRRVPYAMSTVANETPETLGAIADGMGWFQLYPPRNPNIRQDLIARAKDAGFTTLLITVDVPAISRRERQARAGIGAGLPISPSLLWQCATHPAWTLATLRNGQPRLPGMQRYAPDSDLTKFLAFVSEALNGTFDWAYVDAVRKEWDGPLVLKGVLDPDDALEALEHGVDGLMVSNHGGRQLDAAPSSISALPAVAEAVAGRAAVVLDSGIRSGLDVARALALGADFVLAGRPFMFGVAALGEAGAEHTCDILAADLRANMSNLGCAALTELRSLRRVVAAPGG